MAIEFDKLSFAQSQQRMTPADPTKTREQMEEEYRKVLREYKVQVDEILTRQDELTYELQSYRARVRALNEEDNRIFKEFLDRQKEISVGLIFSKTGRKLTEKMMDNSTHRQVFFPLSIANCSSPLNRR